MPTGWLNWDWGNVPSWVGSVLTGSSLGLAAVTYYRARGDRRRELDDAERAQAAHVTLWWVNPRKALVRNSNDVAVTVRAFVPGHPATTGRLGLGPGETRALQLPVELEGRSGDVALEVGDSYGRSWVRHADGGLERVTTGTATAEPSALRWTER
ncbi:hypothetical protein [Actinoplanes solisilvae]|uniref:hypothetical protein n=1 Tax=Actinoplanes solisilvae TaxID=2486853 RepID=UPI0013E2D4C2|nr:hypothetical protein [Actinoplanes solisilvae]